MVEADPPRKTTRGFSKLRPCDSTGGYHYLGSAKFFARIGQAFAEAWMGLQRGAGKK